MVCLGRPYHFKIFEGYLPQILLGPFLNTLTRICCRAKYAATSRILLLIYEFKVLMLSSLEFLMNFGLDVKWCVGTTTKRRGRSFQICLSVFRRQSAVRRNLLWRFPRRCFILSFISNLFNKETEDFGYLVIFLQPG